MQAETLAELHATIARDSLDRLESLGKLTHVELLTVRPILDKIITGKKGVARG